MGKNMYRRAASAVFVMCAMIAGMAPMSAAAKSSPALVPVNFTQGGANLAIDSSTAGATDWTLEAPAATAQANNDGSTPNVALVFGYTDAENYYYADFSTAAGPLLSGIYQVVGGAATKLSGYSTYLTAGQSYDLQVRIKGTDAKAYLNSAYLTKVSNITNVSGPVGVSAFNSNASFTGATLKAVTTVVVNPTMVTSVVTPPAVSTSPSLPTPSDPVMTPSVGRTVNVSTSAQLTAALANAQPGDTIVMADGTYSGTALLGNYTGSFAIGVSGTASNPITLTGSANAVISGNGVGGHYGLYLNGASYWNLVGFSIYGASKGLVLDNSSHNFIQGVSVSDIGDEGIHLRTFSSQNVVKNNFVSQTGQTSPQFGEGIYLGSANSNWCTYTNCQPDTSDANIVIGNTITGTGAESIDIKEGTTGGYIANNSSDGSALSNQNSADSWVDVKGNDYLLAGNVGNNSINDGFQVHSVYTGWGEGNVFDANTANVNGPGYGFNVVSTAKQLGNVVYCDNTETGAVLGLSDVACTPKS